MAYGTKAALHDLHRRKEKEDAMQFFLDSGVPAELERLLNDTARERPEDVFGYLSERLGELSRPLSVARLAAREVYDSSFNRAFAVRLYCTVLGREKLVSEGSAPLDSPPAAVEESSSAETTEGRDQEGTDQGHTPHDLDQSQFVSGTLGPLLEGLSPLQQGLIDEKLMQCSSGRSGVAMGTVLAVSMACARVGEAQGSLPLPHRLARVIKEEPPPLTVPYLVCPVLASGQGKLKMRRFCVTPLPGVTFPEQVEHLAQFHHALKEKLGPLGEVTTPSGHCPPLDRPEQALELIQEVAARCSLQMGKHLGIVLDAEADTFFNAEKGKYECVAGQLKMADEMVTLYVELVQSVAGVVGICNPFRAEDLGSWRKLHSEVGGRCYIFSGTAEHRSLLSQQQQETADGTEGHTEQELFANGTFVQLRSTVSEFCEACHRLQTSSPPVECLLELPMRYTASSLELAADLAVAAQCRFVMTHYLNGMMAETFVTHLLKRRQEMMVHKVYAVQGAHMYTPASSAAPVGEEQSPDPGQQEASTH